MVSASKRGRRARAAGRDEQSLIVRELRALGFEAAVVSRKRDEEGVDVEAWRPDGLFRLAVQSRRGQRPDPKRALLDAMRGAAAEEVPAAVVRWCGRDGSRANVRALIFDWNDERTRALLRRAAGIATHEVAAILDNENHESGEKSGSSQEAQSC